MADNYKPQEDIEDELDVEHGGIELNTKKAGKFERKTSSDKEAKELKDKDALMDQTKSFSTPGTIWYEMTNANEEKVLEMVKLNPKILKSRGNVGENPIHLLALMHQKAHIELLRALVEKYPEQALAKYKGPIYGGETLLHIAIINSDIELVRFLVGKNKKLLSMGTTGSFFSYNKEEGEYAPCCYGDMPLGFAACTNDKEITKFLLAEGADFFYIDRYGNSLLHLMVIHGLQQMYDFLLAINKKWIEMKKKAEADKTLDGNKELQRVINLERWRNDDGFTPLTLAVSLNKPEFFTHIWEGQKVVNWVYGPVKNVRVPLEEIDSLHPDPHAKKYVIALDVIREKNYMDLMMLPRIVDLLNQKWKRYARAGFYQRFFQTFAYVLCLTFAVVLRSPNREYREYDWNQPADRAQIALESLLIAGWVYKTFRELREFFGGMPNWCAWKEGFKNYYSHTGYVLLENVCSTTFIILGVLTFIFRVSNSQAAYDVSACLLLIVCWGYMMNLLLGFRLTGPIIIMIYKIYSRDVVRFLSVYLCVLAGFCAAFYVLEFTDEPVDHGFDVFEERLRLTFLVMLNIWDFDSFLETIVPEYKPLAILLLLLHILTITIMLLNLLIAMMGDTFDAAKEDAEKIWHMSYADIIVSLESEMTRKELSDPKCCYWMELDGRRWLQSEEVNDAQYLKKDKGGASVQEAMEEYDVNHDGVVTFEELQAAFQRQDQKNDQKAYEEMLSQPVSNDALGPGARGSVIYARSATKKDLPTTPTVTDADEIDKVLGVTQEF